MKTIGNTAVLALLAVFGAGGAVTAAPSSPGGAISVAQVVQMLDQAPANRTAQQVLTAYLAGLGEAAGVMIEIGGASCQRPLGLTAQDIRRALRLSGGAAAAQDAAATPLIVRDMLARAGCKSG